MLSMLKHLTQVRPVQFTCQVSFTQVYYGRLAYKVGSRVPAITATELVIYHARLLPPAAAFRLVVGVGEDGGSWDEEAADVEEEDDRMAELVVELEKDGVMLAGSKAMTVGLTTGLWRRACWEEGGEVWLVFAVLKEPHSATRKAKASGLLWLAAGEQDSVMVEYMDAFSYVSMYIRTLLIHL